jgi:hypothetical protein
MKILKEKWLEALPVIWGFISILLLMYLIIWGFSKIIPTPEDVKNRQIRNVEAIKLCLDNGLSTYQSEAGDWYCKPKN